MSIAEPQDILAQQGQLCQQMWVCCGSVPQYVPTTRPSSLGAQTLSSSFALWTSLYLAIFSPPDVASLRQQVEALQKQVQHLQAAFSQYKKGEFLDLNLGPALALGPTLDLHLGLDLG